MLDPRIYRGALVPVLLALIVFAFSLENQPTAARTTLAPEAFVAQRALDDLQELAQLAPRRRPGSQGDAGVAARVAAKLRASAPTWRVTTSRFTGRTIDGKLTVKTVMTRQAGQPGPQLVFASHRDAAQAQSRSQLTGTALLTE